MRTSRPASLRARARTTAASAPVLWNAGIERMEASAAGAFTNVVPLVGLGFAVWFGETVGILQPTGGALAATGVLLTQGTETDPLQRRADPLTCARPRTRQPTPRSP